jgi:PAB1-binding protein PBP1
MVFKKKTEIVKTEDDLTADLKRKIAAMDEKITAIAQEKKMLDDMLHHGKEKWDKINAINDLIFHIESSMDELTYTEKTAYAVVEMKKIISELYPHEMPMPPQNKFKV